MVAEARILSNGSSICLIPRGVDGDGALQNAFLTWLAGLSFRTPFMAYKMRNTTPVLNSPC